MGFFFFYGTVWHYQLIDKFKAVKNEIAFDVARTEEAIDGKMTKKLSIVSKVEKAVKFQTCLGQQKHNKRRLVIKGMKCMGQLEP